MFSRLTAYLRVRFASFCRSNSGNVAMIFGLASVPLVLAAGGFLDYERTAMARSQMQDALDATALALHTDGPTMSQSAMDDFATKYFMANFVNKDAKDIVVTPSYSPTGPTITVSGTATVDQFFLPLIGIKQIPIGATSVTTWGQKRLRVALVLDNTKSMQDDGKMDALHTATTKLIDQLKAVNSKDGDVYISIVPFNQDVNAKGIVDAGPGGDIDWDWADTDTSDLSWDALNGTCTVSGKTTRPSCVASGSCSNPDKTSKNTCTTSNACSIAGKTSKSTCESAGTCSISGKTSKSTCESAGVCSKSQYTSKSNCTSHGGTWTAGVWTAGVWGLGTWTVGVWTPKDHSTWNGCVMDRQQDYDTKNTEPDVSPDATLFPAEQYSSSAGGCPGQLKGLSNAWDSLKTTVTNMSPAGYTNQNIGLVWGWQSLTAKPFTIPDYDPAYQYEKVIIILSDGMNTANRWVPYQSSTGNPAVDAREELTCDALRDAGITVWAVQVNTGTGKNKDPTSQVLKDCATTTDKFYELTDADSIITTFQEIGTALSDLRISS